MNRVSPFLVCASPPSEQTHLRVFCFPHAGGSAALYEAWAQQTKSLEVFVVTPPRTARSDAHFTQLLSDLIDDMLPLYLERPSAFLGHSAGATHAWGVALELQRRGIYSPLRLFASASSAPSIASNPERFEVLSSSEAGALEASRDLLRSWGGTEEALLQDTDTLEAIRHQVAIDLAWANFFERRFENQPLNAPISVLYEAHDTTLEETDPAALTESWRALVATKYQAHVATHRFEGGGGHFYWSSHVEDCARLVQIVTETLSEDHQRTTREAETLYQKWNGRWMEYPAESCLHELFIQQAEKTPDAVALVDGERTFTFQQVHDLSDRLAQWLYHEAGVRPNTVTGILMERCAEFVISYIAALKAGGGYMPLEIVYPAELLSRVIDESQPRAILTKRIFAGRLPATQLALSLDGAWWEQVQSPVLPEDRVRTKPDDLAYIVMSSGTTGVPKGICCPHRGAVHSYHWRHVKYPYVEGEREACNIFFVWELLRPMLKGYPTYVIPDEVIYEPFALADFLERNAITRILFTPSCCQLVLDTFAQMDRLPELKHKLRSLRIVWLCGEVVTMELCARFTRLLPECELLNLYSISECHDVSVGDLRHADPSITPQFAPCGIVMENVELYIFDEARHTVPVGMAGEVYVGGPCVGLGYLNRPEQTAQRFVKHPADATRTLYRTGDRGRLLTDGTLEVLGRCDYMVKIRGYSVVLGAVEVAVSSHPLLSTSVVVTEGNEGEDKRLVAYVVPREWTEMPTADDIRAFLKSQLPMYAIPSCFIPMAQLPLHDASGKLDRKRLPPSHTASPLPSGSSAEAASLSPLVSTEEEKQIAAIWASLLPGQVQADGLRLDDDFFDLGGHSLLSMRLVTHVQQQVHPKFTLKQFLQRPTIAGILAEVRQSGDQRSDEEYLLQVEQLIQQDAHLEDSIYPAATRKTGYSRLRVRESTHANPPCVFLTGATGFLGIFLLAKLLRMPVVQKVYCLIRAKDNAAATARIEQILSKHSLWNEEVRAGLRQRFVPVCGDLAKPLFGLSNDAFITLAGQISSIIHCGAHVNLVLPYEELRKTNVYGTREILRLAVTNSTQGTAVKPVHYISTNSVFPWKAGANCYETDRIAEFDVKTLEDGYSQSKWAAEQLCAEAQRRGLPVTVHRPGNLSGSSVTGASNENDFIFLMVQGMRLLDCAIAVDESTAAWQFDLTPVDWAAKVIAHLAISFPSYCLGECLHIQNAHPPLSAATFLGHLATLTSKVLPFSEWRLLLAKQVEADSGLSENELHLLQKLLSALDSTVGYLTNSIVFHTVELSKKLDLILKKEEAVLACPQVDEATISTYYSWSPPVLPSSP